MSAGGWIVVLTADGRFVSDTECSSERQADVAAGQLVAEYKAENKGATMVTATIIRGWLTPF